MARKAEVKVRITGDSKSAERAAKKTEGAFARMGSSIKANALKITAIIGSLLVAFRQMDKEARLQGQTEALKRNLAAQGIALDDFMAKMKEAADAQLSSAQVIEAAGKALVLGIPAEKMAELMEVAKASAIALGSEVGQAFEDLTLGLARRSLPILDNLGFTTTDLTKAKEDFARAAGTTVDALTGEQTAAALLNGVLTIGKDRVKEYGDAQSEAARQINQAKAAMADVSRFLGQTLNAATLGAATGAVGLAKAYNLLGEALSQLDARMYANLSKLPVVGDRYAQMAADANLMAAEFHESAVRLDELDNRLAEGAAAMAKLALGMTDASEGAENLGIKLGQAGDAANTAEGHFKTATDAAVGLGNALGEVTSIELALEIEKINEALAESAEKLDKNSAEYVRLESIATEKIGRLQDRIRNLRDGLGDLKTATEESGTAWNEYAADVGRAAVATERFTMTTQTARTALNQFRGDMARTAAARRSRGESDFAQIGPGVFSIPQRVVPDAYGRLHVVT